jgi:hypothetical protein
MSKNIQKNNKKNAKKQENEEAQPTTTRDATMKYSLTKY